MMEANLIILAAGISSRMRALPISAISINSALNLPAKIKTKCLIPVGPHGQAFLDYLIFNAREAGYRDVVIVVGENDQDFRDRYGPAEDFNNFHGLTISFAAQSIPPGRAKPFGTADALLQALKKRGDWSGAQFTVCNSDNLYSIRALRALLEEPGGSALIDYDREALQFDSSRIEKFGAILKDSKGFMARIIEKPSSEEVVMAAQNGRVGVSMNLFRFEYDRIFPVLEKTPLHPLRNEKELPTAVTLLAQSHSGAVKAIPISENVPDLTSPDDIEIVQTFVRENFPDPLF